MSRLAALTAKVKELLSAKRAASHREMEAVESLTELAANALRNRHERRRGAPPVDPGSLESFENIEIERPDQWNNIEIPPEYDMPDGDQIETLGRDDSYDPELWAQLQGREVRVESSNVYSYFWQPETPQKGILFVTFLDWEPGTKQKDRSGPGSTYAYYDVPSNVFAAFEEEAKSSPGGAVWDNLRVRGTMHGHQMRYRLIQVAGDYVPRKAVYKGFAERTLVSPGVRPQFRKSTFRRSESRAGHPAKQFFKRSTLARSGRGSAIKRGEPNRGKPNRGRTLF
jgi:hypothetical protein